MATASGDGDGGGGGVGPFARRALIAIGLAVGAVVLLAFLWYAIRVLLLIFAGLLLAIFLYSVAHWISERTRASYGWCLAAVVLVLAGLLVLGLWLAAPRIAGQVDQLMTALPESREQVESYVERYAWGRWMLDRMSPEDVKLNPGDVMARARQVFSITLSFAVSVVVILFVGIYVAAEPDLYRRGLLRLVPAEKRARAERVLLATGHTLQHWLLGRIVAMALVAALTGVGLWLLGIELALTLGLLAGILDFIPNIGPIIAAVPAVALAMGEGWRLALYVALLYVGVQSVEAYLITPLIQRKAVELPPALTIASQVLLGVLAGGLGLLLAVPLVAAIMTLTRMLYVEDVLGDHDAAPE